MNKRILMSMKFTNGHLLVAQHYELLAYENYVTSNFVYGPKYWYGWFKNEGRLACEKQPCFLFETMEIDIATVFDGVQGKAFLTRRVEDVIEFKGDGPLVISTALVASGEWEE